MSESSSTLIRWAKNITILVGAVVALNLLAGLAFDRETPLGFLVSYVANGFSTDVDTDFGKQPQEQNNLSLPMVPLGTPNPTELECDSLRSSSTGTVVDPNVLETMIACERLYGFSASVPEEDIRLPAQLR